MAKRTSRRDEILEAAVSRFARLGFKKTTLDDVASDVGIVKSALYKHFSSKEDLFRSFVDRVAGHVVERLEETLAERKDVEARLFGLVTGIFEASLAHIRDLRPTPEIWYEFKPMMDETTARHRGGIHGYVVRIVDQGVAEGTFACADPMMLAAVIGMAVDTLLERVVIGELGENEARRHLTALLHALIYGLRKRD